MPPIRQTIPGKCGMIIFLLGLVAPFLVAEVEEEKVQRSIVATVAGHEIVYEEIKSDPEIFRGMHPDWDDTKIEDAVLNREKRMLVERIQHIIIEQQIKKLKLKVTQEEVDRYILGIYEETEITEERVREISRVGHAVADAIENWLRIPAQSDITYIEEVKPIVKESGLIPISEEAWEAYKKQYDTLEKIEEFRSRLPRDLTNLVIANRQAYTEALLKEKLLDFVASEVYISSKEVEKHYRELYGNLPEDQRPDLKQIEEKIFKDLLVRRRQQVYIHWLRERVAEADIKIKDERFKRLL